MVCFICKTQDMIESHHIIPRSRGGGKGPRINLCVLCHDKGHKIARSKISLEKIKDPRLRKVVKIIRLADKLGHSDFWTVTLELPETLHKLIKSYSRGRKVNMNNMIVSIIAQYFINKRNKGEF